MRFLALLLGVLLVSCVTVDTRKNHHGLEELRYKNGNAQTFRYNSAENVLVEVPTDDFVLITAIDQMRFEVPTSNAFTCRYVDRSSETKRKFVGHCVYYLYDKPMAVLVDGTFLRGKDMAPYL